MQRRSYSRVVKPGERATVNHKALAAFDKNGTILVQRPITSARSSPAAIQQRLHGARERYIAEFKPHDRLLPTAADVNKHVQLMRHKLSSRRRGLQVRSA